MDLTRIPVEEAITPRNGMVVMCDRWWIVLDGCLLFFKGFAPQCNAVEKIAKSIRDRLYPDADVRFLPLVFVKQSRS